MAVPISLVEYLYRYVLILRMTINNATNNICVQFAFKLLFIYQKRQAERFEPRFNSKISKNKGIDLILWEDETKCEYTLR